MSTPTATPATREPRSEHARLAHSAPPEWINPVPDGIYDLAVIGAGPAGLEAAERAATLGARVALIERDLLGGGCLNTACIPSKTLLRSARLYGEVEHAARFGARLDAAKPDFSAAMARVRAVRAQLARIHSARRVAAAGIDLYFGSARFLGEDRLGVDALVLAFDKALVATGSRPKVVAIPGLAEAGYLTSDDVFDLDVLPRRIVVIGGGPLGCELAQAFRHFGARTTIVESLPLFLGGEERDAAQLLSDAFARDGIEIRLNTRAVAVRRVDGELQIDLVSDDYRSTVQADAILTGMGRVPNLQGLDLDAAGVAHDAGHGIRVDEHLRSTNPRVYAAGDACLEHRYAHMAVASARIAVDNALRALGTRLDCLVVPWCTYTEPEIAHVGLYVRDANRLGIPIKTYTIPLHQVVRAVTDGESEGFIKVQVAEGGDRILGATIVARHAGEMISEITLAMVAGVGLRALADVIHPFPTQADGIRMAAEACRDSLARANASIPGQFERASSLEQDP
jgi:pyruvate/2-oxoglutarate dehydrogenase complex dihydrolipoamide dehydrogenase (E3) component